MPDLHLLICCSITGSLRRLSWDLYLILSHLNMPEQLTSAAVSKLQLSCRVHHTILVKMLFACCLSLLGRLVHTGLQHHQSALLQPFA